MRDNLVSMRKYLTIIYIAVFILCLFQLIIGCGGKSEPPPKAVAVSKRIVSKKSESTPSSAQPPAVVAEKEISDVKETMSNTSAVKVDDKTAKLTAPPNQINIRSGNKHDEPPPKAADVSKEIEKQKTDISSAVGNSGINLRENVSHSVSPDEIAKPLKPEGITTYDPKGKIDPFVPLFKEGVAVGKEKKMRAHITPLEMVDLSQLKLVAIMRASGGNKALVEEVSGKGYIVAKGTYIGNNSGRIVKILNDRLIIEEEIEDIIGKKKIQERELKLQKPLGEE